MRSPEKQAELDNMRREEKERRITPQAMYERGIVIKEYEHWIVCKNEYPHDERGENQLVIRLKEPIELDMTIASHRYRVSELYVILHSISKAGYNVVMHSTEKQSCPFREHWHIYLPQ